MTTFQNEIPVPGITRTGVDESTQQRDLEIFYAMEPDPLIKGGTIAQVSAGAVIASGTLMGRITASGKWAPYDDGASNGLQTARAVLWGHVDTTQGDVEGNLIFSGVLKYDQLTGIDANGITDLGAKTDTVMNFFRF